MSGLAALAAQTTQQELLERYQPGPVALGVVLLLAAVSVLLFRSMRKQIRRVDFDETATDDAGRAAGHDAGRDARQERRRPDEDPPA